MLFSNYELGATDPKLNDLPDQRENTVKAQIQQQPSIKVVL